MSSDPPDKRPSDAKDAGNPEVQPVHQQPGRPAAEQAAAAKPVVQPVRKRSGAVIAPAILLILVALLNFLSGLGFLGFGYQLLNANPGELEAEMRRQNPEGLKALKNAGWDVADIPLYGTYGCFITGILTCLVSLPILFAGTGMLRSRGYAGAVFGSLVAIIAPGGFCILGLVAGIWALIVLFNGNVRRSFR